MIRESIGRALVRHRWPALFVILFITALSVLGISQRLQQGMPVDFTPQAIFIDQGPMLDRLREIEDTFGREDNDLLLMVSGPTLATADGITALQALSDRMLADPDVETISSVLDTEVLYGEDGLLVIEPIFEGRDPAASFQLAADDPYIAGLLLSADQQTTVLRVRISPRITQVADLGPIVHRLTDAAQAVPLPDGLTLQATGVPFVRSEVVDMMIADELFFVPVTAVMFALTICLLFRRILLGLAPLFAVLGAVVWSMGLLLSTGATLNILSILVPVLVLVIGVADGIHLVGRYREELDALGDKTEAMASTIRHMSVACFLTTFTTAAGFASLLVADTRVIRDFGMHSAIAVLITFCSVMFILPVWLAFLPAARVGKPPTERPGIEQRVFSALDRFVARKPLMVIAVCIGFTVVAGGFGSAVQPNSRILEMYHSEHPTFHAIKHTETHLSGVVPILIHFEATEGDLLDPETLEKMAAIEDRLKAWTFVRWTTSLPEVTGRIHHALTGEDHLPPSREAVAQELLLAEMSGNLPMDQFVSADYTQARILAICADVGGREFVKLHADLDAFSQALFPDGRIRVDVTGDGLMASLGVGGLINDLLTSVGLVFIVILGVMVVMLRDLKLAVLSAIPNITPLVFTLAALYFMGVDLQVSNIVSFTVAIGLAVDDTIHFLVRYKQERDAGQPHREAIRRAFLGAGHAIVLTSLLLIGGFGLLSTSDLTTTRQFGILSSITMAAAVFADLFLLPALMHVAIRSPKDSLTAA